MRFVDSFGFIRSRSFLRFVVVIVVVVRLFNGRHAWIETIRLSYFVSSAPEFICTKGKRKLAKSLNSKLFFTRENELLRLP